MVVPPGGPVEGRGGGPFDGRGGGLCAGGASLPSAFVPGGGGLAGGVGVPFAPTADVGCFTNGRWAAAMKKQLIRRASSDQVMHSLRFNAGCVNWLVEIGVAGCVRGGATGVGFVAGVVEGCVDGVT